MKIIKDNVTPENYEEAIKILNKLRAGYRVIGNPAQGLKDTLSLLEKEHDENVAKMDQLAFALNDNDYKVNVQKLKNGIKGEEELAEYFEKIIKYDPQLQDLIIFASLSSDQERTDDRNYIPDSDFLVIYGMDILIIDAKNIRTNVEIPIYVEDNELKIIGGKTLLEVHPSTHIWKKLLNHCRIQSVEGCTVIVNKTGASILKSPDWERSDVKPLHISELREFLLQWIENKSNIIELNTLVEIAKTQIKKEESGLDLSVAHKILNVQFYSIIGCLM